MKKVKNSKNNTLSSHKFKITEMYILNIIGSELKKSSRIVSNGISDSALSCLALRYAMPNDFLYGTVSDALNKAIKSLKRRGFLTYKDVRCYYLIEKGNYESIDLKQNPKTYIRVPYILYRRKQRVKAIDLVTLRVKNLQNAVKEGKFYKVKLITKKLFISDDHFREFQDFIKGRIRLKIDAKGYSEDQEKFQQLKLGSWKPSRSKHNLFTSLINREVSQISRNLEGLALFIVDIKNERRGIAALQGVLGRRFSCGGELKLLHKIFKLWEPCEDDDGYKIVQLPRELSKNAKTYGSFKRVRADINGILANDGDERKITVRNSQLLLPRIKICPIQELSVDNF